MSFRVFYIVLFLIASRSLVVAQDDDSTFSQDPYHASITNKAVIEALRLHHDGFNEKSLKTGLEILASNTQLTQVDSFKTYQVIAYNLGAFESHNLALDYAEEAVKIMQRIDPNNNKDITWISRYYSAVKDYSRSISYMKKDIPFFQNEKDTLALLKLYNDIGFTFYLNTQTDSAAKYYKKVIDFNKRGDKYKGILGLATGNLGIIYLEKGEYDRALTKMQVDAELNIDHDPETWYNAMNAIGECYYLMGQYENTIKTLLEISNIAPQNPKNKLKTFMLLARAYENTGKPAQSLVYMKKYLALQEEIRSTEIPDEAILRQLSDAKVSGIQKDLEISKSKVNLIHSELLLARNEMRVYSVLTVFLIVIVVALIFGYKYRQKKNQKIHALQTELITAELKTKKHDLTNVVTNLTYVREFIDDTQKKLKKIQNETEGTAREDITGLIREFGSYKSADKTLTVLQSDIENVNQSFFKKLDEKFPALTQNEKELCGLLLLNLPSKDIAVIRNITPNAVKKARQRIRKKLPILEDQEISTFLESL